MGVGTYRVHWSALLRLKNIGSILSQDGSSLMLMVQCRKVIIRQALEELYGLVMGSG